MSGLFAVAGRGVADTLAGWVRRMGQVQCEGGWYGKADPYGEQVLAVLSFRYDNGKEPHILVVGIDQPSGGLAVDALVEEAKFLDELDLRPTPPESVAARMLDAFALTDRVMGGRRWPTPCRRYGRSRSRGPAPYWKGRAFAIPDRLPARSMMCPALKRVRLPERPASLRRRHPPKPPARLERRESLGRCRWGPARGRRSRC
ncbi:hypothetical protein [Nonomuraea salmonea]|uniref:hypothetical protein n=1 Tax=Nonomuraea salmonea TaxID=46181 RepID=UPI0031F12BA0